ncbi:c-type cytochrome [Isosphaeraceae bacterium EP7]
MTDEGTVTKSDGSSKAVGFAMIGLVAIAATVFLTMRPAATPPPAALASDPLLLQGREVFLDRCVSCHGAEGRGDGPLAKTLTGPPVGNLASGRWKHGDRPEDVSGVIAKGTPNTMMPAWLSTIGSERVGAVTAYVYHLAGRPIPVSLRERGVRKP